MQLIAEDDGRHYGKTRELELDDDLQVIGGVIAKAHVSDIPPKPRAIFRRDVGIISLAFMLTLIIAMSISAASPDSLSGTIFGAMAAVLFFAVPVVAWRGEGKDQTTYNERVFWLSQVFAQAAEREIHTRIAAELQRREQEEAARLALIASRPTPPPEPQPYGVSPRGAEQIVCEWMRHLGAKDAEVTDYTSDGGIDVISEDWIAQVKHYQGSVGVQAVRELAGVAVVQHRRALFFTSTGYAAGAIEFADSARIALFVYSVEQATLEAANGYGALYLEEGLAAS